jgi:surface antigen
MLTLCTARTVSRHVLFLGTLLAATISLTPAADASRPAQPVQTAKVRHGAKAPVTPVATVNNPKNVKNAKVRYAASPGISCVPFARAASGITVKGNAADWWHSAAGVYERGALPEPGSVLNFRATGGMRLGHVAVVTQVVSAREVIIDHANWGARKGGVARGIPVIDVSDANDWTRVKVARGQGADFGKDYPTYGFIYDRPDRGTLLANTLAAPKARFEEVAEARSGAPERIDAPYRSVR